MPDPSPLALAGTWFSSTTALAQAIRESVRISDEDERELTVRRVFQAVRIAVNEEFTALDAFLRVLPKCLKPGARVAILTFHSGEDRRVKQVMRAGVRDGIFSETSDSPDHRQPGGATDEPAKHLRQVTLGGPLLGSRKMLR